MRSPSLSLAPDRSKGTLTTRFAPAAEVSAGLKRNVMACVRYGRRNACGDDPREIPLTLEPLGFIGPQGGDHTPVELWTSDRAVDFDRADGIGFAHNGELLFGHIYLLEVELGSCAAAAFQAYARVTAFLERQGYPHLLRCWNFLHDINRGSHDQERYRQFCLGRYQALAGSPGFERQLPAATAIGMHEPGLLLYFLAGKTPGVQVENPRQVPAFHYPRTYGPRSPSFSRATYARFGGEPQLLVSGTASVVGHATQHPDDPPLQFDETTANLDALLAHGAAQHLGGGRWEPQALRLFLRGHDALAAIRERLERTYAGHTPLMLLEGDICRRDLHLEIEGQYGAVGADAA
jgi:chorismate lyase / 3-hydroxybenzoate synthase